MIFLDNASTTKPDEEILSNFINYSNNYYFNPGALYSISVNITLKIDEIRKEIVKLLNGDILGNFIFTGSSSEANNIIVNSVVTNNKLEEYVFSSLEHPSVFNVANKLVSMGKIVHFIGTNLDGTINEEELFSKINLNTKFVSIINVSNETGAINNVNRLAKKIKEINPKVLVHSDGVQALGKIKVNTENLDFYTISSHKIYGLKGIAGFYCKNIKLLKPLIIGGGQEFGVHSGTTNAPMIFSFYDAIKKAVMEQEKNYDYVINLKSRLIENLQKIDFIKFNSNDLCSPYIISLSVIGLNAETILNLLSKENILVGLGSACSSKKSGNRILESMNKTKEEILGNLRISFSKNNTMSEVEDFCKTFIDIINKLKETLNG